MAASARWISSRFRNSIAASDRWTFPLTPAGFWLKNSRFWQKSKTKKNSLSREGPNRPLLSCVPRPSIWKNFVFDQTSLKDTRFTASGTSMPVSSMSTDTAMCGAFSGFEKSSRMLWAYAS